MSSQHLLCSSRRRPRHSGTVSTEQRDTASPRQWRQLRVAACAGLRLAWLTVSSFPLLLLSPPLPALLRRWPPLASHTGREGHPSVKTWYSAAPQRDPASPISVVQSLVYLQ